LTIDQLSRWKLTSAEKEVAFLLLKGLSLKELAEVRWVCHRDMIQIIFPGGNFQVTCADERST
jgi:hypothetical protein